MATGGALVQGDEALNATPATPLASALPRLHERSVVAILLGVLALQVYALSTTWGYPQADSVEFMERAWLWVDGKTVADQNVVRSFAFSLLLTPIFALASLLELEDLRWIPHVLRTLQMAVGLGLVFVSMRLGARIAGRAAGLAAGVMVGINPTFLTWTITPVSGVAAALFLALGIDRLLERPTPRGALLGGLWMGASILMAYQSILVLLPVLMLIALRDRRHPRQLAALAGGITIAILLQIALDRGVYGEWGISLKRYLIANFGPVATRVTLKLGFTDLAREIYSAYSGMLGYAFDAATENADLRQLQPGSWYITNLPTMLAWPVLACFVLGLAFTARRPTWATALLALAFAVNVGIMSMKGAKAYRLWLPLLPLIAPLAALGWSRLYGQAPTLAASPPLASNPTTPWRRAFALLLLAIAVPMGPRLLARENLRYHGVYWDALEEVERHCVSNPGQALGSAYHWAVFLRNSPNVKLVRTPYAFDPWQQLSKLGRTRVLRFLIDCDWLLIHHPALSNDPEFFRWVSEHFEVHAAFYDREVHGKLGPVYVLHRRDKGGRRFFVLHQGITPEAYREARGFRDPVRAFSSGQERAELLGWHVEPLNGSGWSWITYHWHFPAGLDGDWRIAERVATPGAALGWHNEHLPAHGLVPGGRLEPGTIVEESYLLVPAANAFRLEGAYIPLGDDWRKGELLPAILSISLLKRGPDGAETARMLPELLAGEPDPGMDLRRIGPFFLPP